MMRRKKFSALGMAVIATGLLLPLINSKEQQILAFGTQNVSHQHQMPVHLQYDLKPSFKEAASMPLTMQQQQQLASRVRDSEQAAWKSKQRELHSDWHPTPMTHLPRRPTDQFELERQMSFPANSSDTGSDTHSTLSMPKWQFASEDSNVGSNESPSGFDTSSRRNEPTQEQTVRRAPRQRRSGDVCSDRLCYGLPMGCLERVHSTDVSHTESSGSLCSVLVTSKHLIDPYRPAARDIHFELVALPVDGRSSYAAVGFSESGRMSGLVSECLQYRDANTQLQVIKLAHSYNLPSEYRNIPVSIISGIKNLGVSYENGYYQCRWVVESAVEFTYEDSQNGSLVQRREDLGYKSYHILLASGAYDERENRKDIHTERASSVAPTSLAQTGHIRSLGAHILIRIHGSLMITIWLGLVTLSILLARYYKNEWHHSKINNLAIWFVVHRAFMLIAWFGSLMAVIFAYMYTETYHPGVHQISGSTCLVLATVQVLGGLFRPSTDSSKRVYFNWAHFFCGNLSYLFAMISIVSAAHLAPAHLPPLYIWAVLAFVAIYALAHLIMTVHQYVVHKSSKISITPMSDLNDNNSSSATYSSCGFVSDSYPKTSSSTFRQIMLGILVTIIVIFIVLLIALVNMN